MRNIILAILLFLCIVSCNKNTFTTIPQIKFKSVNTTVLQPNQILSFTLTLTDKEGDVSQGSLYIQKVTPNCSASDFPDSVNLPVFSAGNEFQGDVLMSYSNGSNNQGYETVAPQCEKNDTCYFRFALKDNAGNTSDTVNSPTIVIIK